MLTLYSKYGTQGAYRALRFANGKVVETGAPMEDFHVAEGEAVRLAKQFPGEAIEVVFVSKVFKGVTQAYEMKLEEPEQLEGAS